MSGLQRAIILLAGQCVVLVTLAVLVGLGHDSAILDGLMAVAGSIVGVGAFEAIKGQPPTDKSE